jgi:type I restriction enzyme M protein
VLGSVGGRKKKVDIAIFKTGLAKEAGNVRRIVVCRPEPKKNGHKGVTKLRDHDQAEKDLEELKAVMSEAPACDWGL